MLQALKVPTMAELAPREAALAKLRGIEAIRVDRKEKPHGGGASRYVIDLFMRGTRQSNASVASTLSPASVARSQLALHDVTAAGTGAAVAREHLSMRAPDAHADKTYLEVHALKEELGMVALACQCKKRCRLCQSMFEFIAGLDKTPPPIVRALSTTERKKHEIEMLINSFVGIVVRAQILTATPGVETHQCDSDARIPIMIKDFLGL